MIVVGVSCNLRWLTPFVLYAWLRFFYFLLFVFFRLLHPIYLFFLSWTDLCGLQFRISFSLDPGLTLKITHHNVIPSYTYAALYSPGAELGPHLDRQQCEFTLSLTHLQLPSDKPWDIQFGMSKE
jgi:hypothetical protein